MANYIGYILFSLIALGVALVVILWLTSKIARQNDEIDTLAEDNRRLRDRIGIERMEGKR